MADQVETEEQSIKDLREKFFEEHGYSIKTNGDPKSYLQLKHVMQPENTFRELATQAENVNDFDEHDLSRLRRDDLWLRCFIRAKNQDITKALEALVICLRWRKTFGVNELTERQIDRRLFEIGFLYPHNRDKEGNSIILFIGKNYKKDQQQHMELKRFLVFLLEKHARMYPSRKVTLVFDMQETGLANMDMDFIKFIVTCFTNYFPNTLAWMLVVELPWILSAAWKIVKTWLSPEAVNKIKFMNKQELLDFVDEDKVLVKLGGTDTYEYSYPPSNEDNGLGPPERDPETLDVPADSITSADTSTGKVEDHSVRLSFDESDTSLSKKVKFEEKAVANNSATNDSSVDSTANLSKSVIKTQSSPKKTNPTAAPEQKSVNKLLNITPAQELVFSATANASGEILQVLTLDNSTTSPVAFKVKTTSPESYRVRPSSGRISPNSFTDVSVFLQPGHETQVARDKFLVMSTEIKEGMTSSETATVWKTAPKSSILEHRLRCSLEKARPTHQGDSSETSDEGSLAAKLKALTENLKSVEKKVDRIDRKISYVEDGLQLFIKVQLGLFSGMIVIFAVVFYYVMYFIP